MNALMHLRQSWHAGSRRGTRRGFARRSGCPQLRLEPLEGRLLLSDGTGASTALVKDLNPGSASSIFFALTYLKSNALISESDGTSAGLWKSDGTAKGTVLLKSVGGESLTNVNGTVFFSSEYGDATNGDELWKTDGTAKGTVLVKDINPGNNPYGYIDSHPRQLTNVNGTLFFTADDGKHGNELWKSGGTAASTVLVNDIRPGSAGTFPGLLTNVNGTLFFNGFAGTAGSGLWKSDGTAAGTVLVKNFKDDELPGDLTNVNGTLYFTIDQGKAGDELWKSDGTEAGTMMVKDIYPGATDRPVGYYGGIESYPNSSYPDNLTNVNGTLFFVANDGTHGRELWKSDGSRKGTVLVKEINPGGRDSYPMHLTNVKGTLFFAADDGTHGSELWKSDGTSAGTVRVADINPGNASSNPTALTNVNGALYFAANDGAHGSEPWRSNGKASGTVLLKDINPGGSSSSPEFFTLTGGHLFFTADDGVHGDELWDPPISRSTQNPVLPDDAPHSLDPRLIPATTRAFQLKSSQVLLSSGVPERFGAGGFTDLGAIDQAIDQTIAGTVRRQKLSHFVPVREPIWGPDLLAEFALFWELG
jgi:trimeric autotransporter adhesin